MKKFILWLVKVFKVNLPTQEVEVIKKVEVPVEIKDQFVDGNLVVKGNVGINGNLTCKGEITAYKK